METCGTLDDQFASFLKELDVQEDKTAANSSDGAFSKEQGESHENGGSSKKRQRIEQAHDDHEPVRQNAETLRKASFHGNLKNVQELLDGLSVVGRLLIIDSLDPDDGFAALHLAVMQNHLRVAATLLRRRADVDVAAPSGDTPLMWAAHLGNLQACKELLRAGADASLRNGRGRTAAMQAKGQGHRKIQEMLENHAFDVAVGLRRRAATNVSAAEARRAANSALVAEAIKASHEAVEEEEFWAKVRTRREENERQPETKEDLSSTGYQRGARPAPWPAAEVTAAAFDSLPAAVRPHYRTLGAPADATESTLRVLYRKLALQHHPDKNPKDPVGAKERFTKVALAYEAVSEYLSKQERPQGAFVAPPKY